MTTVAELVDTPPPATAGFETQPIDGETGWRAVLELADPAAGAAVEWFDITAYWLGYQCNYGAAEYAGRFRATITTLELLGTDDQFAPWNPDTSATFGVHVDLGAGLLVRFSLIRVAGGVVAEWLPRWTCKVERWGDAGYARGRIRRHPIVARGTSTSLVGVPVPARLTEDWTDRVVGLLADANWGYGLLAYHDFALMLPDRDEQSSAINELDATLDPVGLVWYTDRYGHLVVRPRIGDTLHGDAWFDIGVHTTWFHYMASPTTALIVAYVTERGAAGFELADTEEAVRNHVRVTSPGGVFDDEDAVSIVRYDRKTFQATWVADNDQAATDILNYRTGATHEATPLTAMIERPGFRQALDLDWLFPVTITHRHTDIEPEITATGHVRSLEETCRPVGDCASIDMAIRCTVDVNEWETSASMLPVEDLHVTALGPTGAQFAWTNPAGQPITPTNTQVRMITLTSIWLTIGYPETVYDWGGLTPETSYQFQVRLVEITAGVITANSPVRQVTFTTLPAVVPTWPGDLPDPPDGCSSVAWRLEESTEPATWDDPLVPEWNPTPVDSGTLTAAPWDIAAEIAGYPYDPYLMYRIGSNACGAGWVYSTAGIGECTVPALSTPPFDDPDLEAYWPAVCPADQIVEAITQQPATHGSAFESIIIDGLGNAVVVSDGQGLVAYGVPPTAVAMIAGGDASILARVMVNDQPSSPVVLFGIAGLWIEAVADGANWAVRGKAHEDGAGITTITGATALDFGAWYELALTHDTAAEDLILYVDTAVEVDALGIVAARHDPGLFEIGVPDDSLITNCAVFSRVLDQSELPGTPTPPPLTVTINQKAGQPDPATGTPILFEAVFSREVFGFSGTDVVLTGTAGATVASLSTLDDITYTVGVSGMTASGTVIANIPAAVCTAVDDSTPNDASTSSDNTIYWNLPLGIAGWGSNTATATINISTPNAGRGVAAGDICIAFRTRTTFGNTTQAAPAGWTMIDDHRTGSNNPTAMYARYPCDGTETTVTFGSSASGDRWVWFVVPGSSGYESPQTTGAGSTSTSATPAGVTATAAGSLMVQVCAINSSTGTVTRTGASWTVYTAGMSAPLGYGIATYIGSGASPSITWSTSGPAVNWGTGGVVIKP